MDNYTPGEIEKKWQQVWRENKIFSPNLETAKRPFYNLMMFPYPSAEGLHVGNMYAFCGSDIYGRMKRMQGYDVFEPIGLDGFGIHSENYAIQVGKHPKEQAKVSQKNFYRQLEATGNAYDWQRTLETYDQNYYKWTQWIFIQLYKKGLAYRSVSNVNFCPSCKTVLADEQVIDGKCERCGTLVKKRKLMQWFFRITEYADRLLVNLEKLDWSEKVKIAQKNWIGKSEGAEIEFRVKNSEFRIKVFTTRPDTLFGATFLVLAPEHGLVSSILKSKVKSQKSKVEEIRKYVDMAKKKSELERKEVKEKTGVFTGLYAINPVNGDQIPIWIADYVLMSYGTGAIMAVPAHDERDFEFAKKYRLPIKQVIIPSDTRGADMNPPRRWNSLGTSGLEAAYEGQGRLVNSGEWDGWEVPKDMPKVLDWFGNKGFGKKETQFHLRDWLISRQRYWGPPIPMIDCKKCGWQPEKEENLPVLLPDVFDWKPTGTDQSPLAAVESFVNTKCPNCGGAARRETDVSDTFLDSAWYFLRYTSVDDLKRSWTPEIVKKWLPVDMYIGGAEHSVLHLLYTRFLTMVFKDIGVVDFEEPFSKFRAHGLLISKGAKMSKSKGNIVNPDDYIEKYGADTLRCYLMFCGRFTQGGDFSDKGIEGMSRFLKRVWKLVIGSLKLMHSQGLKSKIKNLKLSEESERIMHATIKKVTDDIQSLDYNTAISALMIWLNALEKRSAGPVSSFSLPASARSNQKSDIDGVYNVELRAVGSLSRTATRSSGGVTTEEVETLLLLLAPFAPHMSEELWQRMSGKLKIESGELKISTFNSKLSIHLQPWPKYDPALAKEARTTLVVQVNGKVRDKIDFDGEVDQNAAEKLAVVSEKVRKYIEGKKYKAIYVPGRLINFVVD